MVYKVTNYGDRTMMVTSVAPRVHDSLQDSIIRELAISHILLAEGRDISEQLDALETATPEQRFAAYNLMGHLLKEIQSQLFDIHVNEEISHNVTYLSVSEDLSGVIDLASRKNISELSKHLNALMEKPGSKTRMERLYQSIILAEESLILMAATGVEKQKIKHLEKTLSSTKSSVISFVKNVKGHYSHLGELESKLASTKEIANNRILEELSKPFSFLAEQDFDDAIVSFKRGYQNDKKSNGFFDRAGRIFNNVMQTQSLVGILKAGILVKHYKATRDLWNYKVGSNYQDAIKGYDRQLAGYRINKEEHAEGIKRFKSKYAKDREFVSRKAHKNLLSSHNLMNEYQQLKFDLTHQRDSGYQPSEVGQNTLSVRYENKVAIIEGDKDYVVAVYPDRFVSPIGAVYAVQIPKDEFEKGGLPEFTEEFRNTVFGKATNFMSMADAVREISTDEFTQKYFFNKFVTVESDEKSRSKSNKFDNDDEEPAFKM